jgi:hypothetical protein
MRWMSRTFFAIASKSLQPAIRHLLDRPNQRALDNVARMTAEARRRNLQPAHWLGMVIEAAAQAGTPAFRLPAFALGEDIWHIRAGRTLPSLLRAACQKLCD